MKDQFVVSKDFIKQAHKAACSEWKQKIEEQFPEMFMSKEYEFGESVVITEGGCNGSVKVDDSPLVIGTFWAPKDLKRKCLVVNPGWKMNVTEEGGKTVLSFIRE
jgi:hypothetical protein